MSNTPRNDRTNPVTQFCLAMEEDRRAPVVRVRTAREMVRHFFPLSEEGAVDRVFLHMPAEVRGPIVSGWKIRGQKSALRDSDEKVRQVVADALAAGDIDEAAFEQGLSASILIDWIPLAEWWSFWRTDKLSLAAIQKALGTGRSLGLFDDAWFLENIRGRGGELQGIDTICESLSKDQLVAWLRKIHEAGDGSAAGFVAMLGWDVILSRTSQQALLFALDALALRLGLASAPTATEEALETRRVDGLWNSEADVADVKDVAEDEEELVAREAAESGVHRSQLRSYRPVDTSLVNGLRTVTPPPLPRRASGCHAAPVGVFGPPSMDS